MDASELRVALFVGFVLTCESALVENPQRPVPVEVRISSRLSTFQLSRGKRRF